MIGDGHTVVEHCENAREEAYYDKEPDAGPVYCCTKARISLARATALASCIRAGLAPHCDRIEIAGSIRRRKSEVGDIEIVCIPKNTEVPGLFSEADFGETRRDWGWIKAAHQIGSVVKGHPIDGKYIQFLTSDGVKVDLFTATARNWGLIYAIRTGSAAYSHHVLASGWVRNGCHCVNGMLTRRGVPVDTREEADLFKLAGVPWIRPECRSL
jgi:DNA polymerase/3'-5' exonuclease PolX